MQVRNYVVRTLVLAITLLAEVHAHGQLTVPRPRPDRNGNSESYMQVEPVFTLNGPRAGYTANAMRCHDYGPGDISTITAGVDLPVTWIMEASHPGDCYMYISYDGPEAVNFFKIAEFLGCGATDGLNPPATNMKNVRIPAELPPCDHCVLRWEWTSHQQVVNIEFYVQCVDVKIVSTAGPTKPTPMTAIAGIEHLPASASSYRAAYQGQNSQEHLVGPEVATYAPCAAGTEGCIGSGTGTSQPSPNPSPNPGPAPPSPGRPPAGTSSSFSGSFTGIKWRGGFETTNVANEYSEIVGNPPAGRTNIITSGGGLQPRCGSKFLQVNIDGTDTAYNHNRVEIGFHPTTQIPEAMEGTTRYYGWSMAHDITKPISADSTYELAYWESQVVYAQTIGFYISDGQTLKLRARGNGNPDTDIGSMAFPPGQWHDFVMGIKWSSQTDGWVRLWMNGQEVVPMTAHRTMHPGQPSFSHLGIFRIPRVNTEAIMYYDCAVYAEAYDPTHTAGCYDDSMAMGTCSGAAPVPCPAPTPPPPCPAPSPGNPPSPYPPVPGPTSAPSPSTSIASSTIVPDATGTTAPTTSSNPEPTTTPNPTTFSTLAPDPTTTTARITSPSPTTTTAPNGGTAPNPTTPSNPESTTGPTVSPNPPNTSLAPGPSPDGLNSTTAPSPNPSPNPVSTSTTGQSPDPGPQNPPSGIGPDTATTGQDSGVPAYIVAIVSGSRRFAVSHVWILLCCLLLACTSTQVVHQ